MPDLRIPRPVDILEEDEVAPDLPDYLKHMVEDVAQQLYYQTPEETYASKDLVMEYQPEVFTQERNNGIGRRNCLLYCLFPITMDRTGKIFYVHFHNGIYNWHSIERLEYINPQERDNVFGWVYMNFGEGGKDFLLPATLPGTYTPPPGFATLFGGKKLFIRARCIPTVGYMSEYTFK